jgi:hypothetical protein
MFRSLPGQLFDELMATATRRGSRQTKAPTKVELRELGHVGG